MKKSFFAKIGPGAPKTPKKGWNCIGFIRPGASGPRGTKKREKLRKSRKTFCVFDENSDFRAKSWEFLKNHHFALSRNVGIPCKILYIFKSAPPFSRAPLNFNGINGFLAKIAILGPKVHFLAPNATSRTPCAKPFINTSSWEVFWRPRAAKVRFGPEKLEISLQNRNFVKKAFFAQKVQISRKGWEIHEMLHFLL